MGRFADGAQRLRGSEKIMQTPSLWVRMFWTHVWRTRSYVQALLAGDKTVPSRDNHNEKGAGVRDTSRPHSVPVGMCSRRVTHAPFPTLLLGDRECGGEKNAFTWSILHLTLDRWPSRLGNDVVHGSSHGERSLTFLSTVTFSMRKLLDRGSETSRVSFLNSVGWGRNGI